MPKWLCRLWCQTIHHYGYKTLYLNEKYGILECECNNCHRKFSTL